MWTHRFAGNFATIAFLSLACSACMSGSESGFSASSAPVAAGLSLTVTKPGASEIVTKDESIALAGTANSGSGVTDVSWSSNRGVTGQATGTDSWTTALIELKLGENVITITATDGANNSVADTIVINRESAGKASALLSWQSPTAREDGTPLIDLKGYRIHYGRMSGVYDYQININNPGVVSYLVNNLPPGDWYFRVTAFDRGGAESAPSEEAHRRIM